MGKSESDPSEPSGTKTAPIIIQFENSSFNAGIILNETNYDIWCQMMEMHIAEKEKLYFIRGITASPTEKDALSKAFYDGADELQVFTLNQRVFSAKQDGRTLSIYYGELIEIFGELDHRNKVSIECEKDVELYRKFIERQRVHIFLAGLDCEFDQIRGDILRKDPIPELEECYSLVRRESVRLATMKEELVKPETSALVSRNRSTQHKSNPNQQDRTGSNHYKSTASANKSTYRCAHCDQSGHTKSRCFELVGYPDWWDHNRDPRKKNSHKNSTSAVVESKAEQDIEEKGPALVATAGHPNKADDWLWC
ncbi:uncharacterized protein LOC107616183 [Arachis ipaensis]|uniref:uncharacterized protein LOC107616183 n=1 Tax=Arachis ipaensis TaxID=130454 RepID=UPI000A2B5147|nr:uncharacterized protein LOC107616183 [Arachis ipaensis]